MSDSLNATVIVSVFVLMIVANAELELELPDPPDEDPLNRLLRLPALPEPEPEPDEPLEDEEPPLFDPADTDSPGVRLESVAIVPLTGAYSLVSFSAF
jgi:hypothetical protein